MAPTDPSDLTLMALAAHYREGALDPADAVEAFLARGAPGDVLRLVTPERARAQADAASRRWRRGRLLGPLDGVPIAIKDLLDTAGDVTGAGSPALFGAPPAAVDAPVAARLDAAGAVFVGKSTMTELAFSGLGLNPHTGTPGNAIDPRRVPGGSSSGSAVAVARGWAVAAIGSDTGGSVRIPASFQGLVGLKTTDGAIPTDGAVALSTTLDTLGPIARTAGDAWALWRAMAALPVADLAEAPERGRFWAPPTVWREELDPGVHERFEGALAALRAAGHEVVEDPLPELAELDGLFGRYGSFAAHEAWAMYEGMLERHGARMDARVVDRIRAVAGRPSSDYLRLVYDRGRLRDAVWTRAVGFDALLAPTVAVAPPEIAPLEADVGAYMAANARVLRSTTLVNLLGAPAATVPVGRDQLGLPVGLMITTAPGEDEAALAWAGAVERLGVDASAVDGARPR
jgi:aspartyl-tRNA(Asn)/glutamyl-tRNA(Gln) amidotransferase subunit A